MKTMFVIWIKSLLFGIFSLFACLDRLNAANESFLAPNTYSSLGTFNTAGNVVVDLSTGIMSIGGVDTFTGYDASGANLPIDNEPRWVFTFDSFDLAALGSISFTNIPGTRAVAFLSKSNITISGSITANGTNGVVFGNGTGGPAAGSGGNWGGDNGGGTGGGTGGFGVGGGGGGFGGSGGNGQTAGNVGGTAYGDITTQLQGGSGGAGGGSASNPNNGGGGGGGGALQFGANSNMIINSTASIASHGGNGAFGGGGGSGGGLLFHADSIDIQNGAQIIANGGDGAGTGGGAGGGRIYAGYLTSGTTSGLLAALGGSGSNAGLDGEVDFVQNFAVPVPEPHGMVLVTFGLGLVVFFTRLRRFC